MFVLGMTCIGAAFSSSDMLLVLVAILFILNLASACQDISVDSLALHILKEEELGIGNTVQVVAYKCGSVFAGGALLFLMDSVGWSGMWIGFGSIYFICIYLVIFLNLVDTSDVKSANDDITSDSTSMFKMVVENISSLFHVPGTKWIVTFVLFYKLCERGESVFPIFLVDKGIPMTKMAFWNGVVRAMASVGGSTFSGYLLSSRRVAVMKVLLLFAKMRIIPIAGQLLIIRFWGLNAIKSAEDLDKISFDCFMFYLSIASLCVANFFAGVVTTATFTSMMTVSQSAPAEIQTTHYSFLATMEVLGKLSFATVAGALIDQLGLSPVYLLFVLTAILTVPLLWMKPQQESSTMKQTND